MKKTLILVFILLLFVDCISDNKTNQKLVSKTVKPVSKNQKDKKSKSKVGQNTYADLVKRSHKFADNLDFNLDYIRKKGLKDKKYLAEFLGLYWKLDKALKSKEDKANIRKRLQPFYNQTLQSSYHNMLTVDDKLFKANSMSYMRIMWLLDQLDFDIYMYKKELAKVQTRMDNHMKIRGEWQKAVFDFYYDYFKIKKPTVLKNAKKLKGAITTKKDLSFYNRQQAYVLTHFVFAAYDYGNKSTQTRFNDADLEYLKKILPQIIAKFELKQNDDLVGELLTCEVLIGNTNTPEFKKSYKHLMNKQNQDGSFGSYERARKKYGKDLEFRYYLHTTLVCFETFVEFEVRKSVLGIN